MAKECTLSTGKLPLGGLLRNNVVRINDRPNMTAAVYRGRKLLNKTNFVPWCIFQGTKDSPF